jgi:spore coat polysaccharide biosynthesis protein SpsF
VTGIVLQGRIDSSRLPGKTLLPLDGKPLIFRVMEALNHIPADLRILACPEDSVSSFSPLAKEAGFFIFSGPKEDVLERYCLVIRHFSLKRIIRATGDNPFVFTDAAITINKEAIASNADYAAYRDLPYGSGVESVCANALLRAARETELSFDREHVCPYLYNNEKLFRLHRPITPDYWRYPELRFTVDTHEDYEQAKKLYSSLKDEPNRYHGATIIRVSTGKNIKE